MSGSVRLIPLLAPQLSDMLNSGNALLGGCWPAGLEASSNLIDLGFHGLIRVCWEEGTRGQGAALSLAQTLGVCELAPLSLASVLRIRHSFYSILWDTKAAAPLRTDLHNFPSPSPASSGQATGQSSSRTRLPSRFCRRALTQPHLPLLGTSTWYILPAKSPATLAVTIHCSWCFADCLPVFLMHVFLCY